jgi:hypothetical protein
MAVVLCVRNDVIAAKVLIANNREMYRHQRKEKSTISHNFGYGVGDDMDDLLAKYVST